MMKSVSIEQQVAELTEEQKTSIVRVYRWDTNCILIAMGISLLLFLCIKNTSLVSFGDSKGLVVVFAIIAICVLLITFVVFKIVVWITVPYYDKHKARFIINMRSKTR